MANLNRAKPKCSLGRVLATPGALAALKASGQTPERLLCRHASGDWGAVSAEDRQARYAPPIEHLVGATGLHLLIEVREPPHNTKSLALPPTMSTTPVKTRLPATAAT